MSEDASVIKLPSKGKLTAELTRVPAAEARPIPPPKTGVEIVHETSFKLTADSEPMPRVTVWDHDANRVLFSGTPAEFDTLRRALGREEGA